MPSAVPKAPDAVMYGAPSGPPIRCHRCRDSFVAAVTFVATGAALTVTLVTGATDFLTVDTVFLRRLCVLVFIELDPIPHSAGAYRSTSSTTSLEITARRRCRMC